MRKVLICGGRAYADDRRVRETLDEMHAADRIDCVISGGASGADTLGEAWALLNRIPVMRFPAPWSVMGDGAGMVRNLWMLTFGEPSEVVAFPGGAGTRDMVRKANRQGIPVRKVQ